MNSTYLVGEPLDIILAQETGGGCLR